MMLLSLVCIALKELVDVNGLVGCLSALRPARGRAASGRRSL
jgi:hypothetical protein